MSDVDETTKVALYQASDLFVAPGDNIQESFGLTVIEAMACGLPVITSDWNGYRGTVEEGRTGFRVPTYMPVLKYLLGDPEMVYVNDTLHLIHAQAVAIDLPRLIEALICLGNDSVLRREMGRLARQRALSTYDRAVVGDRLCEMLQQKMLPAKYLASTQPTNQQPPHEMTLWDIFAHYPTGSLEADTCLKITPFGGEALIGELPVYMVPELASFLALDQARAVGQFCAAPQPLEAIVTHFSNEDLEREWLVYTIYWLLKQGFLQVCTGTAQEDEDHD